MDEFDAYYHDNNFDGQLQEENMACDPTNFPSHPCKTCGKDKLPLHIDYCDTCNKN